MRAPPIAGQSVQVLVARLIAARHALECATRCAEAWEVLREDMVRDRDDPRDVAAAFDTLEAAVAEQRDRAASALGLIEHELARRLRGEGASREG